MGDLCNDCNPPISHIVNACLDFKEGDRAEVARMIRDAGMARQVLVYDEVEAVPEWHKEQRSR
jgi:hypothetical protein